MTTQKTIKGEIKFKILNIVITYIAVGKNLKFSLPKDKFSYGWHNENEICFNVKVTKEIAEDYINSHYAILNTEIKTQIKGLKIIRYTAYNSVHSCWIDNNLFYFSLSRPQYFVRGDHDSSLVAVGSLSRIKECYKSYLDFVNRKYLIDYSFSKIGLSENEINKIFKYDYRQLKHCKMVEEAARDDYKASQKYCSLFHDFNIKKHRDLFYESMGLVL